MSAIQKRLNIMSNRIGAAKHLFFLFKAPQNLIEECEDILETIETIPKLAKNPQKAQIVVISLIERSENILKEISALDWKNYKGYLDEQEEIREYYRQLERQRQDKIIDAIKDFIVKNTGEIPETFNYGLSE